MREQIRRGRLRRDARAWFCALLLVTPVRVLAGQTCEPTPPDITTFQQQLNLATTTVRRLNESGADIVIIGRVGQDLSKYRQRYSHLAFAYRDDDQWYVVHKLNDCGTPQSHLYVQGMAQFFMDNPFELEAYVSVPESRVQQKLLASVLSTEVSRMHEPRYNMLAYPWATRYQQSNQWITETLAMALGREVHDRAQAQRWLQSQGYQPDVLDVGPLTRLGGRMFKANIAFDDHPDELRYNDKITTTTADSVFTFLKRSGLEARHFVIAIDAQAPR